MPHILVQEAVKKALAEPDKISVLFADEMNRGEDSRVTNSLMQFLQARTLPGLSSIKVKRLTEAGKEFLANGGSKAELQPEHVEVAFSKNDKLPENFRFILAANPTSDMPGYEDTNYQANDMDKAQISRSIVLALQPDLKSWIDWATDTNSKTGKTNIHPVVTEFVSTNRNLFHDEKEENFITSNPRAWSNVSKAYEMFLKDNDQFVLQMLVAGVVGRDTATTFIGFMREANDPILKPRSA